MSTKLKNEAIWYQVAHPYLVCNKSSQEYKNYMLIAQNIINYDPFMYKSIPKSDFPVNCQSNKKDWNTLK